MASALGPLAFWEGYERELLTLALYAVGIALYALLVGLFYQTLSKRNLVDPALKPKGPGATGFLFVFPLVSFGMFLVLSIGLFFLAKSIPSVPEPQRVRDILLLSMAVVAGVRVAAYISERAAEDLAKLVPLGLLGVLLVDPGYLSVSTPFERLALLPTLLGLILRYLLALVALELLLRLFWVLLGRPRRDRREAERVRAPAER